MASKGKPQVGDTVKIVDRGDGKIGFEMVDLSETLAPAIARTTRRQHIQTEAEKKRWDVNIVEGPIPLDHDPDRPEMVLHTDAELEEMRRQCLNYIWSGCVFCGIANTVPDTERIFTWLAGTAAQHASGKACHHPHGRLCKTCEQKSGTGDANQTLTAAIRAQRPDLVEALTPIRYQMETSSNIPGYEQQVRIKSRPGLVADAQQLTYTYDILYRGAVRKPAKRPFAWVKPSDVVQLKEHSLQ